MGRVLVTSCKMGGPKNVDARVHNHTCYYVSNWPELGGNGSWADLPVELFRTPETPGEHRLFWWLAAESDRASEVVARACLSQRYGG